MPSAMTPLWHCSTRTDGGVRHAALQPTWQAGLAGKTWKVVPLIRIERMTY